MSKYIDADELKDLQEQCNAMYIRFRKVIGELAAYRATGISPDQIRQIDAEYQKLATELAKYKKEERDAIY